MMYFTENKVVKQRAFTVIYR